MSQTAGRSELEARAAAGDPQAQFEYGLALLEGDEQAVDGPRGIALIDSACAQGHADAAAMCALFEAIGAGRPQSWERALDRLQQAASAGLISAQGQLLTLSERGAAETRESQDWAAIRTAISVERLLAIPARQMLSDAPRIVAYGGFATAAECRWVMARASERLTPAEVIRSGAGDQTTYESVRDNSAIVFLLPQMDVVLEVLRGRIAAATHLPVPIFEPMQALHYAVGQQFKPHHDFLDPNAPGFAGQLRRYGQRIATVLVYLNDEYSGGETVFPKLGLTYRGSAGDALFWTNVDRSGQPDHLTTHAGTPPTAGEKWVISQWIRDRAAA